MAELYLGKPLFPGNSEMDQIFKICSVLGTPSEKTWPKGLKLTEQIGIVLPHFIKTDLKKLIPNACPEAIDLLDKIFVFQSEKRISVQQALNHVFFQGEKANPNKF